ncbi:tRNA (guanosine(37)-N1)-methyltransferase TrmD [Candidatus Gracilibacteria bacterium]|nr:MAG: tRNA (guanosine(37)-N1)-methyltransferase TrmD [Candidatus Gracilibacteria bacterium]
MNFHIITIFPESFESYFSSSIMKRAIDKGLFSIKLYKLNDFSKSPTKRVDDKAYGMHGQVILADVLSDAIEFIFQKNGKKIPVIYLTPSGELLNQEKVEYFYENLKDDCIIICGHYEGIDQRIIDLYVDFKLSIGDYVLSSGEIAACVFIDSFVRNIPNVLGNKMSLEEDSFSKKFDRKREYPVYTRPKTFKGLDVPKILLSGNHKEIESWKKNNLH